MIMVAVEAAALAAAMQWKWPSTNPWVLNLWTQNMNESWTMTIAWGWPSCFHLQYSFYFTSTVPRLKAITESDSPTYFRVLRGLATFFRVQLGQESHLPRCCVEDHQKRCHLATSAGPPIVAEKMVKSWRLHCLLSMLTSQTTPKNLKVLAHGGSEHGIQVEHPLLWRHKVLAKETQQNVQGNST